MQLKNKVLNIIIQNKLLQSKDKVLLAVSGGADSIALLYIFNNLQKKINISLQVAHFNHGFRGKESDADAKFVKNLCVKLGIPCTINKKNIPQLLKKNIGLSPQDFSRKLRYEFLTATAYKYNCNVIATGHNLHDQTETILLHLFRGTGLAGLTGMQLQKEISSGINLIRPFLFITRKEIENYLNENNIKFREDSSNFSDKYLRNHLRHHFIPEILKHYNPNLDNSLLNLSKIVSDDDDFLNKIVQKKYDEIVKEENDNYSIDINILKKQHPSIIKRLLRETLFNFMYKKCKKQILQSFYSFRMTSTEKCHSEHIRFTQCKLREESALKKITYEHIESILNLMYNSTGRMIDLPCNYIVKNEYGKLIFKEKRNKISPYEYKISVPSVNNFIELNIKITVSICKKSLIKDGKNNAYFSFTEIPDSFILRNRREGDRFIPYGMNGTKKLKKFFIDLKISNEKRDQIPLILYGKDIIWIIDYRKSNKYRIENKGKCIVKIVIESLGAVTK
ncbi:MAG: tRNA lysidine(34) synthetase TilS [Candidatus Firestonebacteria bacterium]|nr:tRNA lysidine(34) synthetase TilS [Candidatus Firestonebacteria bacterium]